MDSVEANDPRAPGGPLTPSKSPMTMTACLPYYGMGRNYLKIASSECTFVATVRWLNISNITDRWNQLMAIVAKTPAPELEWPRNNARYSIDLERQRKKQKSETKI